MGLINRLGRIDPQEGESRLPIHAFHAMLYELSKGKVTKAQIISHFNLDAAEQAELDWLIGRYNAQPNATAKAQFVELINVILMLAEHGMAGYTTNAEVVARINAI